MKNTDQTEKLISMAEFKARRDFLKLSAVVGTGFMLTSCSGPTRPPAATNQAKATPTAAPTSDEDPDSGGAVSALEDLMREHGVLRRALLVYDAAARKLRTKPAELSGEILQNTAKLFRTFGEDYHEAKLEEAYIFPEVRKTQGPASVLPDILLVQHQRGRQITDFILSVTKDARIGTANVDPLVKALESLTLMYQHHAAREDTVLFPAWVAAIGDDRAEQMSETFEDIENKELGEDGYEGALKQIAEIETELGIADISQFTPPAMENAPPKSQ